MTNEDFIEEIWNLAKPKDNKCRWKHNVWPIIRSSRGDLERAWSTVTRGKSEEEKLDMVNKIELALPELAKVRAAEQKAGSMAQPVGVGRFLRDKRWLDCIETKEEKKLEKRCHCGQPLPCETHYYENLRDDWRWEKINQHWRKLGKPNTREECIKALRDADKLNLLLMLKV